MKSRVQDLKLGFMGVFDVSGAFKIMGGGRGGAGREQGEGSGGTLLCA